MTSKALYVNIIKKSPNMTNSQNYFIFLLSHSTINSLTFTVKEKIMNNTPNNNNPYAFKELLNTDNIHLFYAQMLNAVRLDKHNAVYVFDEVGCGKTVSAIMAIAKTIWDKENNVKSADTENADTHFRILVITPKSVCPQFKAEILDKLKFDEDIHYLNDIQKSFRLNSADVEDVSNLSGDSLISEVEAKNHIVIANPHKMCKLAVTKWDLIIIDEAHDIVCNSKKQTEEFHKHDKIIRVYGRLRQDIPKIPDESIQKAFNECIRLIDHIKDENHKDFVTLIHAIYFNELIRHFNEYNIANIPIPENRTDIKLYRSLLKLKAERIMFLSATPYKNAKEPDFLNYMYAATKVEMHGNIFAPTNTPDLSWVEHLYKENFEDGDLQQFENSNTSMLFKEVANSIPFELKTETSTPKETKSKHRFIRTCKPDDLAQLPAYLISLKNEEIHNFLKPSLPDGYTPDDINRAIIFVSCSAEGEEVFEKLFPGKQGIISQNTNENKQHTYNDPITGLTCEFVMNKFGNAKYLNHYSKEQDGYTIPDILIVTWQVAQVGVNLPTFNHVIHYNISQLPGSIEQRFGRIDRMTTSMRNLHNIYCFDEGSTNHYNLSKALENYMNTLVNSNCNLPVKNLLLNQGLELPKYNERETKKFIELYTNTLNALDFNPEDENFKNRIEGINDKLDDYEKENPGKPLSRIKNQQIVNHTSNDQTPSQGMYCDELPEIPDNDSKPTDEQKIIDQQKKTKASMIAAVKRFITMIEDLLDTLNDKKGFNDRIDKINSTNFDAGDIIYAGSSNNNENSETSSESTVKGKINLEEVVKNINRVRTDRNNL